MKKFLLLLLIVISSLQYTQAQLPTGSYAPDFTGTDLDGNTWNLYDLLDQGKTVYIDISAAWCSPCWSYHNSGKLEDLYNQHGPSGTDDVMVFFVEGEGSNTLAQLNGTTTAQTYAGFTQGDWVTGTPYPIIDDASIANLFQIAYFPTVYMICPDRWVTEIGTGPSATQLYNARNNCNFQTSSLDAGIFDPSVINKNITTCNDADISFRIVNYGTTTLTSATVDFILDGTTVSTYNWTGSLDTYESDEILDAATITGAIGDNDVTIKVSNPNNGTDGVSANNEKIASFYVYSVPGYNAFSEDFESGNAIPLGWHSTNTGSDDWEAAATGFNSSTSVMLDFYSIGDGSVFELIPPEVNMSQYNSNIALEFDVAHAMYGGNGGENAIDRLKVQVQECGGNWVTLYNKSGKEDPSAQNSLSTVAPETDPFEPTSANQWRHESISLSNYLSAQPLIIKFEATSGYGNNLFIDNININTTVGINENAAEIGLQVYPNPFSNQTNVYYTVEGMEDVNVRVYNLTGQEVYSNDFGMQTSGAHNFLINGENFAAGMYVMNLNIGNKTVSHKLSVTK
jgi:hypothetical protein